MKIKYVLYFTFTIFLASYSFSDDISCIYSKSEFDEMTILKTNETTFNSPSSTEELQLLKIDPDKTIDLRSNRNEIFSEIKFNNKNKQVFYSKSYSNEKDLMMDLEIDSYLSKGGKAVLFMYHRFRNIPGNIYEVSVSEFEKQVEYLAKNDYEVITVSELVDRIQSQKADSIDPKTAVITVDDGYRCFLDYAYPILKKYNFPATLFVYTDYINTGGQSLTWDELRFLSSEGFDIQSHSLSHPDMTNPHKYSSGNPDNFLKRQLELSKEIIEDELGKEVDVFCWPYGAYNEHALKLAILAGYEATVSVKPGATTINSNEFELKRYGVYSRTSYDTFVKRLEAPAGVIVKAPGEDEMLYKMRTPVYSDTDQEEMQKEIDDAYNAIFEVEIPKSETKEYKTE